MANWKYTLHTGRDLREAIELGDTALVLNLLEKCWKSIYDILDNYTDEDLDNDLRDIRLVRTMYYDGENLRKVKQEINDILGGFYGYCDANAIWIEDTDTLQIV